MGKNTNNSPKQQVGAPVIAGAIAGLLVLIGILYFLFLRPSEPGAPPGGNPAETAPTAATGPAGQPNLPQAPPGDTDKEHVGPDTSGAPK